MCPRVAAWHARGVQLGEVEVLGMPPSGPAGLLTVVDVHKPPEAAPLEDSKPTDEQLLKEAEEYLKAVPS